MVYSHRAEPGQGTGTNGLYDIMQECSHCNVTGNGTGNAGQRVTNPFFSPGPVLGNWLPSANKVAES